MTESGKREEQGGKSLKWVENIEEISSGRQVQVRWWMSLCLKVLVCFGHKHLKKLERCLLDSLWLDGRPSYEG
ncbi:hypothetical protein FRX31_013745 [Thalictrum thalictroides]|uniref:Uncharacterized protein n=1 Tax=Thalictrum thalictroides TaxID=46969 RepID=A0A7J6WIC6_THATH|nr:hypothetical protein FRX31_017851 [Thalictrum thalictroides]KAF5196668.1 hypothetical protein FRX31_013745 [Thalictrum thalictroides]